MEKYTRTGDEHGFSESRGHSGILFDFRSSIRYHFNTPLNFGGIMSVKTSTLDGGVGLIEVKGSLVGGEETDKLRQAIAGFVDREYDKLLIDLSNVTYLNSTAIGVLMHGHTTYTRRNWKLKLCGINK